MAQNKGYKQSQEHILKRIKARRKNGNYKVSTERKNKLRHAFSGTGNPMYGRRGKDNPNWRGGPSKSSQRLREKKNIIKFKVFEHYGLKCACCGEKEYKFLTIDHIKNNGAEHNKKINKINNAITLYKWLIANNFPNEYQTLCFNCNITKGLYGKCPHNI